jgi:glucose-6-phosphate 1-dehydrogenase
MHCFSCRHLTKQTQLFFLLSDDPTITNKNTNTPTFATILLRINTPRWHGVPIIMKAGKALDETKAEVRVQFKDAPAASRMFPGTTSIPRNELVMRLQPNEAVYLKTNVKSPGFAATPVQSELEINYNSRFFAHSKKKTNPDAYTRLIRDVLLGKQAAFVRDDELRRAWEIFTPILHQIETQNIRPIKYKPGSRGPDEADRFVEEKAQYVRNKEYVFYDDSKGAEKKTAEISAVAAPAPPVVEKTIRFDDAEKCDVGLYGLAVMVRSLHSKV